ncbi:DJ-1/PfpI family protein [Neoroseomonas rubea]|uniref:DJ-1/PfpI family protein n=1 Tax=Neoroseomonas rubea TaxID=2748666 RepID=UPI0018E02C61|nr:DJ-1/PfpI family protein [Roseomonas rubea]
MAHLNIGTVIFPDIDQVDLSGPHEVLSRLPDSTWRLYARTMDPVVDMKGLRFLPDATLEEAPQLDVLHIPGGFGVDAAMLDPGLVAWLRRQAECAEVVFTVCTGAILLGAVGLLRGRHATTHWASHHLLPLLGAIPVDERVVEDGPLVTAAGVTSGFDDALRVAARLRTAMCEATTGCASRHGMSACRWSILQRRRWRCR